MCLFPSSLEHTTEVRLRGLCKFSAFDKLYQVSVSSEGDIVFYGVGRTVISYNYELLAWQFTDVINPNISATFESGYQTLALGTHMWEMANDVQCQKGKVSAFLSLTACTDSQFTCGDGLCIGLGERCNGVPDCKDETDELRCTVAEIGSSYNKNLAPPGAGNISKVPVHINITIYSFGTFDIIKSTFSLELSISMTWKEGRLNFNNLKEIKKSNVMRPDEKKSIWFPAFVFENTEKKLEAIVDTKSLVMVERNGSGTKADDTSTENKLTYSGWENLMRYERLYNDKFKCHFELAWYPFDTQKCQIMIGPTVNLKSYIDQIPFFFFIHWAKGPEAIHGKEQHNDKSLE